MIAQRRQREDDIGRGDGLAVGKARLRPQHESHPAAIGADIDALGEKAIHREGLGVVAAHHALEHIGRDAQGFLALDDEGIDAVEAARSGLAQHAALRRLGIGIGQMGKAVRQGRRPMHGNRV